MAWEGAIAVHQPKRLFLDLCSSKCHFEVVSIFGSLTLPRKWYVKSQGRISHRPNAKLSKKIPLQKSYRGHHHLKRNNINDMVHDIATIAAAYIAI